LRTILSAVNFLGGALEILAKVCWPLNRPQNGHIFVTASDHSHQKSLMQLIKSINQSRPISRILVFDLGLDREFQEAISILPNVTLRKFDFSSYPSWLDLKDNSGSYAWKSQCVRTALEDLKSEGSKEELLTWVDAGCVISGRILPFEYLAKAYGVFTNLARGTIGDYTFPTSLKILEGKIQKKFDVRELSRRQVSAALISFDITRSEVIELILTWSELSLDKQIIGPVGATKLNHRFDQAILSILLYEGQAGRLSSNRAFPQNLLGFLVHQDVD